MKIHSLNLLKTLLVLLLLSSNAQAELNKPQNTLNFDSGLFIINNIPIPLPASLSKWTQVLGSPSRDMAYKGYHHYIWDDMGITVNVKNHLVIDTDIYLYDFPNPKPNHYGAKNAFPGKVSILDKEISYSSIHEDIDEYLTQQFSLGKPTLGYRLANYRYILCDPKLAEIRFPNYFNGALDYIEIKDKSSVKQDCQAYFKIEDRKVNRYGKIKDVTDPNTIEFNNGRLKLNGQHLPFPGQLDKWLEILGYPSAYYYDKHHPLKEKQYFWQKWGIKAIAYQHSETKWNVEKFTINIYKRSINATETFREYINHFPGQILIYEHPIKILTTKAYIQRFMNKQFFSSQEGQKYLLCIPFPFTIEFETNGINFEFQKSMTKGACSKGQMTGDHTQKFGPQKELVQ